MTGTTRAQLFGDIAEQYDRARPSVPLEAVDWLLPDDHKTVVDLAAGTGALTRLLVGRAERVIAVEPDARMRAVLTRNLPDVEVLDGLAEAMPLPAGSADAVVIAMAWHWVDADRTVQEVSRVLRDGGSFGVVWNHRDLTVPWVAALDHRTRVLRAEQDARVGDRLSGRNDVPDPAPGPLLGQVHERLFSWTMDVTAQVLVEHLGTDASAAALTPDARRAVDAQVLEYLRIELGLHGDREIGLPMSCRCLRAAKPASE